MGDLSVPEVLLHDVKELGELREDKNFMVGLQQFWEHPVE